MTEKLSLKTVQKLKAVSLKKEFAYPGSMLQKHKEAWLDNINDLMNSQKQKPHFN